MSDISNKPANILRRSGSERLGRKGDWKMPRDLGDLVCLILRKHWQRSPQDNFVVSCIILKCY